MFDERPSVHKLPFYTHSLYSCFINETQVGCCSMLCCLRETKSRLTTIFSNEGEVTAAQTRILTSSEHTDPDFVSGVRMLWPGPSSSKSLSWAAPSHHWDSATVSDPLQCFVAAERALNNRDRENQWCQTACCLISKKGLLCATGYCV